MSIALLEKTWLLRDVPRDDLAALVQQSRTEKYANGELVWRPSQRSEFVALVTSAAPSGLEIVHGGIVPKAEFPSPDPAVRAGVIVEDDNRALPLRRAMHGQLVGVTTALVATDHGVSIVARGEVDALLIPGAALKELANHHPKLWWRALVHANEIVLSMNERLRVERYEDIPNKLAYVVRVHGNWLLDETGKVVGRWTHNHEKSLSRSIGRTSVPHDQAKPSEPGAAQRNDSRKRRAPVGGSPGTASPAPSSGRRRRS